MRRPRYLTKRALARSAVVCTLATLTAGGCGPIEYLNQVTSKAATAVVAAKQAQADRYAPYEYTAAEEYLHKAREEAGYAEYQDSIEYGRKAEEMAQRARAIAINRLSPPSPGAAPAADGGASPAPPPTSDSSAPDVPASTRPPPKAKPRPKTKAKPAPATSGPPGMDEDPPSAGAPAPPRTRPTNE